MLAKIRDSDDIVFVKLFLLGKMWNSEGNFFACKDAGFSEDVLVGLLLGKIQEFLRIFSGELLLGKMWDFLRIFVWNFCLGRCVILRMFSVQLLVGKMQDFEDIYLCQTSLLWKMQDSEDIVSVELLLWCCGGISVVDPGCSNEHTSEGLNWVTCLCTYQQGNWAGTAPRS